MDRKRSSKMSVIETSVYSDMNKYNNIPLEKFEYLSKQVEGKNIAWTTDVN